MKASLWLWLVGAISAYGQAAETDTTLNNLDHPKGYVTSSFNSIPEYVKAGRGKHALILIPGVGFDASVFADFIEANRKTYRMYAITLPGFGSTHAPPMPDEGVSYGEQTWTRSALQGILALMEKEKLVKPVIVGHFITGTQVAIRLAIDHPDKIGRLIVVGGSPKLMAVLQGKLTDSPLKDMIRGTDTYWAPKWFKHMTKRFYDNGNFLPEIYSLQEPIAKNLWEQASNVPMPIMVRYNCEYFASDMLAEVDKIKCPFLVVRPLFSSKTWENQMNKNWIQPQFIESWNIAARKNPAIKVIDVPASSTFVWKDNPNEVYKIIDGFVRSK